MGDCDLVRSDGGRRLRIAITADPELPVPPRYYGGIERIVDMLACELARRGHDVTLFANGGSTAPVRLVGWPGARSGAPLDVLRNAATLARHMLSQRIELVHSFSRLAYLAPLLPLPMPKVMSYQRAITPATVAAAGRLSRGSLALTAVSRQMLAGAAGQAGRWHVVPNGVPLERFQFTDRVAVDAPLVFLGRLEPIKGPHLAVEMARRAGRRLVLAGNVPEAHRGWFSSEVAPHLDGNMRRYVGPVDDAQKSELLGRAAALLMPVLWEEPFGIVMAEAMACGTPVLGLARGAVAEVVVDGETGFVRETVDGLVAAVARLPELSRRAARRRVERHYSAAAVADGYLAVYADVLGRRRVERDQSIDRRRWRTG